VTFGNAISRLIEMACLERKAKPGDRDRWLARGPSFSSLEAIDARIRDSLQAGSEAPTRPPASVEPRRLEDSPSFLPSRSGRARDASLRRAEASLTTFWASSRQRNVQVRRAVAAPQLEGRIERKDVEETDSRVAELAQELATAINRAEASGRTVMRDYA